eukprot:1123883-Karenia_brevis.AAC.1
MPPYGQTVRLWSVGTTKVKPTLCNQCWPQTGKKSGSRQKPSWTEEVLCRSKVKAHTSDEALARKELQNGNWQADRFAD